MERRVVVPVALAATLGLAACGSNGEEANNGGVEGGSGAPATSEGLPPCDAHLKVGDKIDIGDEPPVALLTGAKLSKTEGVIRPYLTIEKKKPAIAITTPDGKEIGQVIPLSRVKVLARAAVDNSANYCKLPNSIPKELKKYVNGVTLTATVSGPMNGAPRPGFIDPPKDETRWTPDTLNKALSNGITSQPASLVQMHKLGYKEVVQGK